MLLSKQNLSLATCAAVEPQNSTRYRLDYLRVDQDALTLTAVSAAAMYVSALPDQTLESEFPNHTTLNPGAQQPIANHVYLLTSAVKAATRHLPRPQPKNDRQYPDDLYPILQHVRVTQTLTREPEYILETNDLATASFTPVKALNDYKTAPDNITWPKVETAEQFDRKDQENEAADLKANPETAIITPEIILDIAELKTLIKIHQAHGADHIQISVSRNRSEKTPVVFTTISTPNNVTSDPPSVISYVMPLSYTATY